MGIGALPVVPCMAAGAIRLVGGCAPSYRLAIAAMALGAVEVLSVIPGIGSAGVVVNRGTPVVRSVAAVAGKRCREVAGGGAFSDRAIVATIAGTR